MFFDRKVKRVGARYGFQSAECTKRAPLSQHQRTADDESDQSGKDFKAFSFPQGGVVLICGRLFTYQHNKTNNQQIAAKSILCSSATVGP